MSETKREKQPNEFELISRLSAKLPIGDSVVVGAGDDCAVIDAGVPGQWQLHKTDAVVEGIHFTRDADPRQVGHKALGRALSDIAAMAGTPRWATITLGLPDGFNAERIESVYDGMNPLAKQYNVSLVGGETVRNRERLFIGVSLVGEVARDRCLLRSGAAVGDGVWVTGELGGSIAGHHLTFTPRLAEARWLAEHFQPSAMIDLSDGLAGDLGHFLHAAGVGAELLESALPIRREARLRARESEAAKPPLLAALTDGEDYELCFTLGQGQAVALFDRFKQQFPDTPLCCIGKIVTQPGLKIRQKTGLMEIATRAHVHFQ
ncbi:MAG: thiamine-phosphate kinase [Verrucomicrobiota bacterium]|nr:thiamine-phosphate kinase [Verrucomicrobiota bacterium]